MADDRDHALYALDRVRRSLGDFWVAANYPGGPKSMHNDLLQAEHRIDIMVERIRVATAVLQGEADGLVAAWWMQGRDDVLCDHCGDLSARMLRAARDRARADLETALKTLRRARFLIQAGLRAFASYADNDDELLTKLAQFFHIDERRPIDG